MIAFINVGEYLLSVNFRCSHLTTTICLSESINRSRVLHFLNPGQNLILSPFYQPQNTKFTIFKYILYPTVICTVMCHVSPPSIPIDTVKIVFWWINIFWKLISSNRNHYLFNEFVCIRVNQFFDVLVQTTEVRKTSIPEKRCKNPKTYVNYYIFTTKNKCIILKWLRNLYFT